LGDRKGVWPVKTSASKLLVMVANVSRHTHLPSSKEGAEEFSLCCEDAQGNNDYTIKLLINAVVSRLVF